MMGTERPTTGTTTGAEEQKSIRRELKSSGTQKKNKKNEKTSKVRLTGLAEEDTMVVDVTEEEQEAGQR